MSAPLAVLMLAALVPAAVQATWLVLAHRILARRTAAPGPSQAASLSVLIPVCGDEPGLEQGLVAALSQSWPGPEFEVCIVASDAADPAAAIAARALAHVPGCGRILIATVPGGEPGKALLLAAGAAVAHGDWLVLLDSDARLPDSDYLRRFCGPLADPAIGLVTCVPVHRAARSIASRALAATLEPDLFGCFATLDAIDRLDAANGACLAVRADTLRQSGGLEVMRGRLLMDAALARAVRRAGGRVQIHRDPLPVESGELDWRDVFQQSHRWLTAILRGLPLPAAIGFVWLRIGVVLALVLLCIGDALGRSVAAAALATRLVSALELRRVLGAQLSLVSAPLQLMVDVAAGVTWMAAALDPRITWRGKRWRVGSGARLSSCDDAP